MMLGDRIKQERIRLGFKQFELAQKLNVTAVTLMTWEQGKSSPNGTALQCMADLGIDVLYVVTGERSKPVQESLSPEELALIDNYRNATNEGRQAARTVLFAVSKLKEAA